jgi:alpha-mannosidase
VLCWVAGKGYSAYHGASLAAQGEGPLLAYVQHLLDSGYRYDLVQVRYSTGGDNGPPDPSMCDFVRKWNETYVAPRLVIATTSELFREFEQRYGGELPQMRGDFTPYWEDGAASSARETGLNRAAAERLTQAETLFAMLNPKGFPADEFSAAWRNVLLYDEHTWGAYNSISEPDAAFVREQWRIKQAFARDAEAQSLDLLDKAAGARGILDAAVAAVDVCNTSSWMRTDLVTLPRDLRTAGEVVKGPGGKRMPSQRLSTGELVFLAQDVPPLAGVRYTISRSAADQKSPRRGGEPAEDADVRGAKAEGNTLTTPELNIQIDPNSGAISSLRSTATGRDLVDPNAPLGLNEYRYMLGSDTGPSLPLGLGLGGGVQPSGAVKISVRENGPLVAALAIDSDAPGCRSLRREVRVVAGLDRVEIINTLDKLPVREKEGVHFGFGFAVPDATVRMDLAWAVLRPETDQLPGACRNWFTVQRWADVSNAAFGVTWALVDAPLVEVGGLTADRIGSLSNPKDWLAKIEPSSTLYSWVMNNHWHTNYRAEQEGPTVFRYALRPHGTYDPVAAQRCGIECSQPLIAVPTSASYPLAPPAPLKVEPADVLVAGLRPTADGRALLIRLFNAADRPVTAQLTWYKPPVRLVRGVVSDDVDATAAPAGRTVRDDRIELPPSGVETLRAEMP